MARSFYKFFGDCIEKYGVSLLIILIVGFHFVSNYIILVKHNLSALPVSILESKSYAVSLEYFYAIREFFHSGITPDLSVSFRYAPDGPLYFLTTIPFYFLFGCAKSVAILSNTLSILILLTSVYFIGKRMCNKNAGILACLLVSMIPGVYGYSQVYHIPVMLMALSTLVITFLIYSNYFSNTYYSLLFGVSSGLLCLTKFSGVIYLIGPLIYLLYKMITEDTKGPNRLSKVRLINLSLAGIVCGVLLLFWYLPQGARTFHGYSGSYNFRNILGWREHVNFIYIDFLIHDQLFPVLSILFILCLIFFLFFRIRDKGLILLWLLVPYLFFTMLWPAKESYFTVPCLSAVALIMSIVVETGVHNKLIKHIFIIILVFFITAQHLFLCYGAGTSFASDPFLGRITNVKKLIGNFQTVFHKVYPVIIAFKKPEVNVLVLSLSRDGMAIESLLVEAAAFNKLKIRTVNLLGCLSGGGETLISQGVNESYFLNKDFILYTTDYYKSLEVYSALNSKEVSKEIIEAMRIFESCKNKFKLVQEIPMAGSDRLLVYERLN
ncbi:MAG: glycosyltransferase family 39 protein [Candidatus Omnitrophica bacterium]|nr:glycosyltransferase family 39 protein [Candidatus Omnitrophota bacterium]MBU2222254.1 glycosyltransferase family 39 protein [Candidatus Omnitrophota bacterium]